MRNEDLQIVLLWAVLPFIGLLAEWIENRAEKSREKRKEGDARKYDSRNR